MNGCNLESNLSVRVEICSLSNSEESYVFTSVVIQIELTASPENMKSDIFASELNYQPIFQCGRA